MLDRDIVERGAQAEQARAYMQSVIDTAISMVQERIFSLQPDQTLMFTVLKSQAMCLGDIMALVEVDITEGRKALERIQGNVEQKGGIL